MERHQQRMKIGDMGSISIEHGALAPKLFGANGTFMRIKFAPAFL
jgi:hypothetical protein